MNKNALRNFLSTVNDKKYIGVVSFDIIQFATDKELVERTEMGNFRLTSKGLELLDQNIDPDVLSGYFNADA